VLTNLDFLFPWLLFLHVLGAIVAFGPTFAAPVTASLVAKEPQYGNFFARAQVLLGKRLITPVAISLGVTGILMILVRGIDVMARLWLPTAIVLYLIALGYALFVQSPAGVRLVELTSQPPGPGGPSPELRATAAQVRRGGMLLGLLVVAIVLLMVVKPF
jgi:hypothetical protein